MITIQELLEETQRQNLKQLGYNELQIMLAVADFRRLISGSFDMHADQELIDLHDVLRIEIPKYIKSLRKSKGNQHN